MRGHANWLLFIVYCSMFSCFQGGPDDYQRLTQAQLAYWKKPKTIVVAPKPSRDIPKLTGTLPPLPEGKGRIVFDCIEFPCEVREVLSQSSYSAHAGIVSAGGSGEGYRTICTETPCWSDFEYGSHVFHFTTRKLQQCESADFLYSQRGGACGYYPLGPDVSATATTNPVVVRVRPDTEYYRSAENMRYVTHAAFVTFEVPRDQPYATSVP